MPIFQSHPMNNAMELIMAYVDNYGRNGLKASILSLKRVLWKLLIIILQLSNTAHKLEILIV